MDWIAALPHWLQDFLVYLLPVVIAAYGTELTELLQRWNTWLDSRSPRLKRIVAAVITYAGAKLAALLGAPVGDLGQLLAAGLTYLFHAQDTARVARAEGTGGAGGAV